DAPALPPAHLQVDLDQGVQGLGAQGVVGRRQELVQADRVPVLTGLLEPANQVLQALVLVRHGRSPPGRLIPSSCAGPRRTPLRRRSGAGGRFSCPRPRQKDRECEENDGRPGWTSGETNLVYPGAALLTRGQFSRRPGGGPARSGPWAVNSSSSV